MAPLSISSSTEHQIPIEMGTAELDRLDAFVTVPNTMMVVLI